MKKNILSFLAICLFVTSFAQSNYKKGSALGIHFFFDDFQTAADIRTNGLVSVLKDNQWSKTKRMNPGLAISYLQGLSNHVDFAGTLSGSFVDYPVPNVGTSGSQNVLLEAAATANLKLLTDKYWISPFLTLGAGVSKFKGYYGAFIPVGVGIQVNLSDEAFILLNSQYRVKATENVNYHFYHSIGVAGSIFAKKVEAPKPLPVPVAEPVKDRDGDGIADSLDKCPDVAGIASLQGCPDKDGDGITDADDKCPDVAGLARYNGCPIPDTDGDGINDESDKCPTVAGVARYQGCPIPDTDGDGVNDEEDKCPNEAGTATNFGCPEIAKTVIDKINVAAKNIFFATSSAKLLPKSFKSLNDVAKILSDNPSYKLDIDGHTDNTGKPDKNQILSENRAKAVATYIQGKGIDETKLVATGYGQDKPIADNKTSAGRAKNRRVEIKVKNY
jgi:OOP family OmpA-OmpF porin